MTTFHIENHGCRATAADAAAIEQQLRRLGYARSSDRDSADIYVLNTCTVTAAADAQARDAIRKARRGNPAARIVVTGCYAQRAPEDLAQLEGVWYVVGNSHQASIGHLVGQTSRSVPAATFAPSVSEALVSIAPRPPQSGQAWRPVLHAPKILTGDIFALKTVAVSPIEGGEADQTRPILKIQDGCDHRCAYCVIPFVRGRSRSLPPAEVVKELQRLVAGGAKEIVLSGINLGSYGRDLTPRVELLELLRRALDETALDRLRLSSIEPMDVTQELVELVACEARLAQHFHVPLQSGSDCILAAMHRWYRAEHYARRMELIRDRLPHAGIGADVIAGFPGETEADHRATVELIERLPFTYLHVFSFSSRPGTEAARLIEQERVPEVPPQIIQQRARELRALGAKKAAAFRASQAGRTLRVLTLRTQGRDQRGPYTEALSSNYLTMRVQERAPANCWREVSSEFYF
jgi:threonylcarbamoyladenosine tRNA methylthiotransferase MtaB